MTSRRYMVLGQPPPANARTSHTISTGLNDMSSAHIEISTSPEGQMLGMSFTIKPEKGGPQKSGQVKIGANGDLDTTSSEGGFGPLGQSTIALNRKETLEAAKQILTDPAAQGFINNDHIKTDDFLKKIDLANPPVTAMRPTTPKV